VDIGKLVLDEKIFFRRVRREQIPLRPNAIASFLFFV